MPNSNAIASSVFPAPRPGVSIVAIAVPGRNTRAATKRGARLGAISPRRESREARIWDASTVGDRSARAEISQLRQIDLHPGRIDLAHIEVLGDQATPRAKVAQRLDLQIDLAARREVEGLRLAEIRRAGIDGEAIGAGRQIAIENGAGLRRPDRCAVDIHDRRAQAFAGLVLAQEPDAGVARRDRRPLLGFARLGDEAGCAAR